MALPDSCMLTDTHLVFSELVTAEQLADADAIYEHCCFIACTNALRPLGPVEAAQAVIPELDPGTSMMWGTRVLSAEAAEEYRVQGLLLCELRLRVKPHGGRRSRNGCTTPAQSRHHSHRSLVRPLRVRRNVLTPASVSRRGASPSVSTELIFGRDQRVPAICPAVRSVHRR